MTVDDSLREEVKKIRAELKHLDQIEDVLDEARGEFEHELRRAGDALVRAGGRSWGVENRLKELKGNVALNRKDLEENKKRRQKLEMRLKQIEQKLS
jgi:chromosome segregation ATPase